MEVFIEDKDLEDLETCMEVADPGESDDAGEPTSENQRTWKKANGIVEGLRMLLPKGSDKRLKVSVE
jgi:hypothetical protein